MTLCPNVYIINKYTFFLTEFWTLFHLANNCLWTPAESVNSMPRAFSRLSTSTSPEAGFLDATTADSAKEAVVREFWFEVETAEPLKPSQYAATTSSSSIWSIGENGMEDWGKDTDWLMGGWRRLLLAAETAVDMDAPAAPGVGHSLLAEGGIQAVLWMSVVTKTSGKWKQTNQVTCLFM